MNVPTGTELLEFTYRGRHTGDKAPYSMVCSYLVQDLVAPAPLAPGPHPSPWGDCYREWLTRAGIDLDHLTERLTARPPIVYEALTLDIAPGVAVMAIERTAFDTRGRVVESADLVMPGDRIAATYITYEAIALTR